MLPPGPSFLESVVERREFWQLLGGATSSHYLQNLWVHCQHLKS